MVVQPGLCQTRSETRTLVFSCRGSNVHADQFFGYDVHIDMIEKALKVFSCHIDDFDLTGS